MKGHKVCMVCDPPERHVVLQREDKVSFIGVTLQLGGSSQGTPAELGNIAFVTALTGQHVQKGSQPQSTAVSESYLICTALCDRH